MGYVEDGKRHSDQEEQASNSGGITEGARIISYNINEEQRPGGMKIRFKVRVVEGKQADALNERQAEAIRELLKWARQHRNQQQNPRESP